MSSLFEDLKEGLEEAIAYEKGYGAGRVKTYMILPVKEYSGKEIRDIRTILFLSALCVPSPWPLLCLPEGLYLWEFRLKQWKHGKAVEHIQQDRCSGF